MVRFSFLAFFIYILYLISNKKKIKNIDIPQSLTEETITCIKCKAKIQPGQKFCENCGASIDITKSKCTYCDTEIKYFQEWIII